MKSYLFLLLLVLIACDVEEKTNENEGEDIVKELMKNISEIIQNCGVENIDCIQAKFMEKIQSITPEDLEKFKEFLQSPECPNECSDTLKSVVQDETMVTLVCSYLCGLD